MPAGGLVTAGVLGLGEAAIGLINSGKAKREARKLAANRPKLPPSPYTKDQISLAESELSNGMSADAKTAYEEGMDKSQSTSLGTALRMGATPNEVGSILANSMEGRARYAIMKDNLRLSKIRNLYEAQGTSEQEREKEIEFNQWMPWADEAQANAAAKQTANSEIFSGLSTAAGGVMRFAENKNSNQQFQKYLSTLGKGNTTTAPATSGNATFLDGLLNNDE